MNMANREGLDVIGKDPLKLRFFFQKNHIIALRTTKECLAKFSFSEMGPFSVYEHNPKCSSKLAKITCKTESKISRS